MRVSTTPPRISAYGCTKQFIHKVEVSRAVTPIRQKLCRLPLSVWDGVSKETNRLLTEGIIEKIIASPWVSPIVVVDQEALECAWICMSQIRQLLQIATHFHTLLKGVNVFSTIDLEAAYFQLPLHKETRNLTAFVT